MIIKKYAIFFMFMVIGLTSIQAKDLSKVQTVKASFYAQKFHKRKAASGEIYHKDSMVCAHKTYPFGTMLEVRNPINDKFVVVKVIDRGPFTKGRALDLSYAAAKELGIIAKGIASIEMKRYVPFRYEYLDGLKDELEIHLLNTPSVRDLSQVEIKITPSTLFFEVLSEHRPI